LLNLNVGPNNITGVPSRKFFHVKSSYERFKTTLMRIIILTTSVPFGAFGRSLAAQTPLDISQWVAVGRQYFTQQRNVRDRQAERVNLAEPLLIRERGHMTAELVERRVDAGKHP